MPVAHIAAEQKARNPAAIRKVVAELNAAFGNRVVTSQAVREQHGNTVTWIANQPPDAVVYPQNTEEVQQIVRICAASGVAIIPFGVGTSLEGHVNAPVGGVSVDFRDMDARLLLSGSDEAAGARPNIFVALKGPFAAPARSVDVSALTGWLTLRAVENQTKRLRAIENVPSQPRGRGMLIFFRRR